VRGARDIEGKVTRAGASKPGGERVSIQERHCRDGRQSREVAVTKLRQRPSFKTGNFNPVESRPFLRISSLASPRC
jgi:hypothetical protein